MASSRSSTSEPSALREALEARATELGFARLGVAAVGPLEPEGSALSRWLADGRHGAMDWMARTEAVRLDPGHPGMLPGARRVVVLVTPYARSPVESRGPAPAVVARYARGRDYHHVVGKRLRKLVRLVRDAGYQARGGVDSLPILERAWAQRAGVGFIGKNCCLIVPGLGSHVFLAALVTDAPLPVDAPMSERCGGCTLCLTACPTEAFDAPRSLDARRCISYLTIEERGPIDEALRPGMGRWLFGCDACQDVCPFNRTSPAPAEDTIPFAPRAELSSIDAAALLEMDEAAFLGWAAASPLRRPGRAGVARNAAIVLGNAGERRHLPVLDASARGHDDAMVRDAAAWAAARIRGRSGAGAQIAPRSPSETPIARGRDRERDPG